ncbi:glycosyltransferase family 39 protein [Candidatus Microgenomates bacterium]|nr:glycosyltransferase family 39 protein [Candidatus Microgenomates bacterium]
MKMKAVYLLGIILILTGVFFRFQNLRYNSEFEWDQENSVAYPAKSIVIDHKLPLIGAKTSVGNLYVGPLYSYLAAVFFFFFKMDPIAGAYLAATVSVITIITGYLLMRKLGKEAAFFFTLLWSTSPLMITYDRIPWNVNLLPLAVILTFFGLYFLLSSPKTINWILLGLGVFLGISSHYSFIFVILACIIFFVINRKIITRSICWPIFLSLLGVLPLLVFHFRHGNSFGNNLQQFTISSINRFSYLGSSFIFAFTNILESQMAVVFGRESGWIKQIFSVIFIFFLIFFRHLKPIRNFLKVFLVISLVYLLGFTVYRGHAPSYYFIGLYPLATFGLALVLAEINRRFTALSVVVVFIAFANLIQAFPLVKKISPTSLGTKQDLLKTIKDKVGEDKTALIYDMELGNSFGFSYLSDYYRINLVSREETNSYFWISRPVGRFPGQPDYTFGDFALGLPQTVERIYATKEVLLYGGLFKIRIPKNWTVVQCQGIDFDKYYLTADNSASCDTLLKESKGIVIDNLPDCPRSKFEPNQLIKSPSGEELYKVSERQIAGIFEENRCVNFSDLDKNINKELSSDLTAIVSTLKK